MLDYSLLFLLINADDIPPKNLLVLKDRAQTISSAGNDSALMEEDGTNNDIDSKYVRDTQKVVGNKAIDESRDNDNVHKENSASLDRIINFKDS